MSDRPRIHPIEHVSVEHLLGSKYGPLVKLRVEGGASVHLDELTPANAREIASHLFEAAARAEYEADFYETAKRAGLDAGVIAPVLSMIREGEQRRHEGGESDGG